MKFPTEKAKFTCAEINYDFNITVNDCYYRYPTGVLSDNKPANVLEIATDNFRLLLHQLEIRKIRGYNTKNIILTFNGRQFVFDFLALDYTYFKEA